MERLQYNQDQVLRLMKRHFPDVNVRHIGEWGGDFHSLGYGGDGSTVAADAILGFDDYVYFGNIVVPYEIGGGVACQTVTLRSYIRDSPIEAVVQSMNIRPVPQLYKGITMALDIQKKFQFEGYRILIDVPLGSGATIPPPFAGVFYLQAGIENMMGELSVGLEFTPIGESPGNMAIQLHITGCAGKLVQLWLYPNGVENGSVYSVAGPTDGWKDIPTEVEYADYYNNSAYFLRLKVYDGATTAFPLIKVQDFYMYNEQNIEGGVAACAGVDLVSYGSPGDVPTITMAEHINPDGSRGGALEATYQWIDDHLGTPVDNGLFPDVLSSVVGVMDGDVAFTDTSILVMLPTWNVGITSPVWVIMAVLPKV